MLAAASSRLPAPARCVLEPRHVFVKELQQEKLLRKRKWRLPTRACAIADCAAWYCFFTAFFRW